MARVRVGVNFKKILVMKIRAIEIEDGGKVTRYTGKMEVESSWEDPAFTYKPYNALDEAMGLRDVKSERPGCKCGHREDEHLPECIYKVEGCECEGYVGAGKS